MQQLESGFPLGRARLGGGRLHLLSIKADGYGSDDALVRAVSRLRGTTPTLRTDSQ